MLHAVLAHPSSMFFNRIPSSSSSSFSSSGSTNAASRFPQCLANITTKMVDAMEEYEKEAGCVPILHPEVKPFNLLSVRTHANIYNICRASLHVCDITILQLVNGNSNAACKTTVWGGGGGVR